MAEAKTRTYEIDRKGGEKIRITIPEDWKVTYGPVIGEARAGGDSGNVLRIYETKEKQRALFTRVEAFRDLTIPCQKQVRKVTEDAEAISGPKGSKAKSETAVEFDWQAA
jgi:hypothetical protein